MRSVLGRLQGQGSEGFSRHRVEIAFRERAVLPGVEDNDLWRDGRRWSLAAEDGTFAVGLVALEDMQGPWTLRVLAPDGRELGRQSFDELPEDRVSIEVPTIDSFEVEANPDPLLGRRAKLSGRVLDGSNRRQVSNALVVVWARPRESDERSLQIVFTSKTDSRGYFSGEYPSGEYDEAAADVTWRGTEQLPIHMNGTSIPRRLILVLTASENADSEGVDAPIDCGCEQPTAPRSPDAEDLANAPDSFSTDLGGGRCVDFTAPNRALEEFSFYTVVRTTEPAIKGVSIPDPNRVLPAAVLDSLRGVMSALDDSARAGTSGSERAEDRPIGLRAGAAGSAPADLSTAHLRITVDSMRDLVRQPEALTPTNLMAAARVSAVRELAEFADALAPSAPGRATLDARHAVDWDYTPTAYQATTIAHGHILHFKQVWRADGYSLGDLVYSLPLAPCQKKQVAIVDWDRRESATRSEELTEREQLAAVLSRDRDIAEIVSTTLTESLAGGSQATTFGIGGGIGGVIKKVLVFGVSGGVGRSSSSAWQDSARRLSAQSLQQLRDRTLQSASAVRSQRATVVQTTQQGETVRAQTEFVANHNHCHALTVEYFEVLRHLQVTQELADVQECLFVPLAISPFDRFKALRWRSVLEHQLLSHELRPAFGALDRIHSNYEGSDLPAGRFAEEPIEDIDGELRISFVLARPPGDEGTDGFLADAWVPYEGLLWDAPRTVFNLLLRGRAEVEKDRIFKRDIAPRIAAAFIQKLRFAFIESSGPTEVKLDATLVSAYAENTPLYVSLRSADLPPAIPRERIRWLEIRAEHELPPHSKVVVRGGSIRYRSAHLTHALFRNARVDDDLLPGDPTRIATPLASAELRNPRQRDKQLGRQLVAHLNEHLEHYHKVIWSDMDPDRRYMLLDGFLAPGSDGRSVASVVENRVIGVVGNSLVMPVAPGHHLDPTYRQNPEQPLDLIHQYAPTTPIAPMRVSIPTRGVFAEAVMGSCNSCEEKDDSRFWRFEESPCSGDPTAIQPVSTDTRRADPGDLSPTALPAPMINLQNAPAAPDPTGLGAALQLLGVPNLFRDVAGLEGNQANALAALTSALQTARSFGAEAASLVRQKQAVDNAAKVLQTIERAGQRGMLAPGKRQELTAAALERMLGLEPGSVLDSPELKQILGRPDATSFLVNRPPESFQATFASSGATAPDPDVQVTEVFGDEGLGEIYGDYDLAMGDRDSSNRWGGQQRSAANGDMVPDSGEPGYVRQLQQDLRELGFAGVGQATGVFDARTRMHVREFQIYAGYSRTARVKRPVIGYHRYADSLEAFDVADTYEGPISGVVNEETRYFIQVWKIQMLRCPVVIEGWSVDGAGNRTGQAPVFENLWRHSDPHPNTQVRMFATDFTNHYGANDPSAPAPIGQYTRRDSGGGPESRRASHLRAEVLPEAFVGKQPSALTAAERSTFKVIRAVSEAECDGYIDGINAYDNVILSTGPYHWPVGAPSQGYAEGGDLGGFLAYLREHHRSTFDEAVGRYGLEVQRDWNDPGLFKEGHRRHTSRLMLDGELDYAIIPLNSTEMNYLRNWHWFYRFIMAARTNSEYQRAMFGYARIRLRDILATPFDGVLMRGGSEATFGDVFTSERAVAMVLRWHVRAPGHVTFKRQGEPRATAGSTFRRVLAEARRHELLIQSNDVNAWNLQNDEVFVDAMMTVAATVTPNPTTTLRIVRNWPAWANGNNSMRFQLDPDVLDPNERRLSLARGSFAFAPP